MTTVETRVVDPVHKHSPMDVTQDAVDAALSHEEDKMLDEEEINSEEDKMLDDEEINSCEGEDVEDHLLNVAIMKSVVETVAPHAANSDCGADSPRYGLRKRQRPGDSLDAVKEIPKHASPSMTTATILNGRLSLVRAPGPPAASGSGGGTAVPTLKQEPTIKGVKVGNRISATRQRSVQLIAPNISVKATPSGELLHPGAPSPTKSITAKKRPQATRQTSKVKGSKGIGAAIPTTPSLFPSSGAVPNPLSRSTPPPSTARSMNAEVKSSGGTLQHGAQLVPCPLPAAVPCPLPEEAEPEPAYSEKKVTIADPPVPITRSRIFSVDLDPSTFDFPDMSGDHKGDDDMEDITAANLPDDLAPFKRDRAFSFEFFSFAGDDLLPAPPVTAVLSVPLPEPTASDNYSSSGRPRGDSIIFDPASFQDGGIHEKNAIIKVKAAVTKGKARTPSLLADSRLAAAPPVQGRSLSQPAHPIAAGSHPGSQMPHPGSQMPHPGSQMPHPAGYHSSVSIGVDSGKVATLPSALSVPDANGNSSGTFQMELLNKDGRIGIYLPEARRARIARFHAKRKMRIWRKRIKYDCRKKLADSRPRIKGRFVKRSDMDE